jgi:prephenate dehydrogenase
VPAARTLCIVGLGLMGGSLALSLKQSAAEAGRPGALYTRIVAVNRSRGPLEAALALGAIDSGTTDLVEAVAGADAVVLATPVRTILNLLAPVGRAARAGTLILDLGSSKGEICRAMARLPDGLQPVGGHPLCGKETAGFGVAEPGLYREKAFVLCPLQRTDPSAVRMAEALVRAVGARPYIAAPEVHDRAVAAISHLPYVASVALTLAVEAEGDALAWDLAASGFRDTSRLSASDVDMMLDTLLTNRSAVLDWLDT